MSQCTRSIHGGFFFGKSWSDWIYAETLPARVFCIVVFIISVCFHVNCNFVKFEHFKLGFWKKVCRKEPLRGLVFEGVGETLEVRRICYSLMSRLQADQPLFVWCAVKLAEWFTINYLVMLTSSDVLPRVGTPLFAKFLLKWKLDRVGFISGSTCVKIRKNIGTYNGELYMTSTFQIIFNK